MRKIILLISALFLLPAMADLRPMSLTDIGVMQRNADGTYSVVCTNGNRETVTDLDLSLNNVCPNRSRSEPTNILSLQKREDGSFNVVCDDFTSVVATAEQILNGQVCMPKAPQYEIEDGAYTVESGYSSYCDQSIEAKHSENVLISLRVNFTSPCNAYRDMECKDGVCSSGDYRIKVLSKTSYEFAEDDGSYPAVFVKK